MTDHVKNPEDYLLDEPIDFKNGGRQYRYDFKLLTVKQVVWASKVLEFAYDQTQTSPSSLVEAFRSGSADYLIRFMSLTTKEMKNGQILPFNITNAETKGVKFFEELPAEEIDRMEECFMDFFSRRNKTGKAFMTLSGKGDSKKTVELLKSLMTLTTEKQSKTSKQKQGSQTLTPPENLKDE